MNLKCDRKRMFHGNKGIASEMGSGIFVRAIATDYDGKESWGSYDIAELDKESLLMWLRSRGEKNALAENVVGVLLGHGHLTTPQGDV